MSSQPSNNASKKLGETRGGPSADEREQVFASFVCGAIKAEGKHAPGRPKTNTPQPSLSLHVIDYTRKWRHVFQRAGGAEFMPLESQSAGECERERAICILQALHLLSFPSEKRGWRKIYGSLFKINGSILGAFQILYLPSCTFSLIKEEPAAAVPFGVKQKSTYRLASNHRVRPYATCTLGFGMKF